MFKKLRNWQWLLLVFIVWRVCLFGWGVLSQYIISYEPSFPYAYTLMPKLMVPKYIYSWANFDGVHYLTIARQGYEGTALIQAFFPLYPAVVGGVNSIIHNLLMSGYLVSHLFTLVALFGWFKLIKIIFPKVNVQKQRLMTIFFLLFPTSFFLVSYYSESLFLALTLWFFIFVYRKNWLFAAVLAGLASATKVVGIGLIIPLIWHLYQNKISLFKHLHLLFIATSGLLVYMIYLKFNFSDPLYFFHVQSEFGAGRETHLILYPQALWRSIKIVATTRPIDWKYFAYVQDLIAGTLGLLIIAYGWLKKVKFDFLAFSLFAFLLPTVTGNFSSMPRYLLSSPAVIMLICYLLAQSKKGVYLIILVFTIWLLIDTMLFIQGYWVA